MSIYLLWGMLALLGFVFVIIFLYTICCMFKYIRKKKNEMTISLYYLRKILVVW